MTTPAATIQQAIDYCAGNIGLLTFNGAVSIYTRMSTWLSTLFTAATPLFTQTDGDRTVSDWRVPTDMAQAQIEGPGVGACGLIGCSAVIDVVTRTLSAVRDSTTANYITTAQRAAVIAAFNTSWT